MVSIILWPYFRFAVFAALNCENRCIPIALLDLSKDKFKDAYILAHLSTVFFLAPSHCAIFLLLFTLRQCDWRDGREEKNIEGIFTHNALRLWRWNNGRHGAIDVNVNL